MGKLYGESGDGHRDVVLTFDDGPSPKTTPRLLDYLAEQQIKAVFFVIGDLVSRVPGRELVTRAQADGHVVGNHTFTHPNLRKLDAAKVRDEIRRTHDLVCECVGACTLFRPPYGAGGSVVNEVLSELGYTQVMWNVDTLDWKYKQQAKWVDHGMQQIKSREDSIVLMHDIHATTVDNVPKLVARIRKIPSTRFVLY